MSVQAQEQQRHQWLAAIGIDSWLPRAPLPGAAPSPDWVATFCSAEADVERPNESEASIPGAPSSAQARRPAGSRIDTAALLAEPMRAAAPAPARSGPADRGLAATDPIDRGPTERSPTERSPTHRTASVIDAQPVLPQRAARPEPAPRFKLAWLVRGDMLIVDSLPPHQPEGFSRAHRRLLEGITTALGIAADDELSAPFMLPWPMLAGKTLNQGANEARAAVKRKLENTLAFNPGIRQLLLLGEAAGVWVTEQEGGLDALQGKVLALGEGRQALVTLSLSELLRLPERKAEVWRDLQPFRRDLGHA